MTHAVYVYSAYAITTGVLGGYAAWIISRNRKLRRQERTPRR